MGCSLSQIREELMAHKGARMRYKALKGRRKVEERQGVLVETYPKLFTLFVESQNSTVSLSYAEVLTREVELELVRDPRKG